MKEIDFERALTLMGVIEKVVNVSPANQAILGEAQAELKLIEDDCRDNASERANKRAEEESRREVARQQELRAAGQVAELPNETGQDLDQDDDGVADSEDPDDDNDGEVDTDEPDPNDPALQRRA